MTNSCRRSAEIRAFIHDAVARKAGATPLQYEGPPWEKLEEAQTLPNRKSWLTCSASPAQRPPRTGRG